MKSLSLLLLAVAAAAPAVALASDETPPMVKRLLDCRSVADRDSRLACFDEQAATVAGALAKQDIVVADRTQIRKARRSVFGLSLPSLDGLFGSREHDGAGKEEEGVSEIQATIAHATPDRDGKWLIVLEDGARWMQIDTNQLPRDPKPGRPIRIRKAAMGSFLANVDGQIAIRVRRVN